MTDCIEVAVGSRYGGTKRNGKFAARHRIAFERTHGEIPEGLCVLHRCDNTRCVNPDHLFLGTHADNVADKVAKGRQAKGERNGRAKLTAEAVRALRVARERGLSFPVLGREFGISTAQAYNIATRRQWSHVL